VSQPLYKNHLSQKKSQRQSKIQNTGRKKNKVANVAAKLLKKKCTKNIFDSRDKNLHKPVCLAI